MFYICGNCLRKADNPTELITESEHYFVHRKCIYDC